MILRTSDIVAFVATAKPAAARKFYRDTLGLKLLSDDQFALAFDCHGTMLRVQIVEKVAAAGYTALGWRVPDIEKVVKMLSKKGVAFAHYQWMEQDKNGIWDAPSGARVAWFKDPDGNTLSLTEMPAKPGRRRRVR